MGDFFLFFHSLFLALFVRIDCADVPSPKPTTVEKRKERKKKKETQKKN